MQSGEIACIYMDASLISKGYIKKSSRFIKRMQMPWVFSKIKEANLSLVHTLSYFSDAIGDLVLLM